MSETETDVDAPARADPTDPDPAETVALYCRVSTDDQNLDRQREATYKFATERLGVSPGSIQVYTDKRTGTDTDRRGYADLMADLEAGEIDRVVVSEVSRLSRSVRDFAAAVDRIVDDHGAGLHILDMGLDLDPDDSDPYTRAFLSVAATFAELEADIKRQNTEQGIDAARAAGKWTGRAPFGFDVGPEGYLAPNSDFERALSIIDRMDADESKRSLARHTGVSRRTIGRIMDNRDLYETHSED